MIDRLRRHERIVLAGTTSSGKTTLARALSAHLGYEHIELDALHWGPKWRPRETFRDEVVAAIAGTRWIAEGNYRSVRDLVWSRATALVWLDYPFPFVLWRAFRRTLIRGVRRQQLYNDNRESLLRGLLHPGGTFWWAVRSHLRRRRETRAALGSAPFAHLEVFEIRDPSVADALIAGRV